MTFAGLSDRAAADKRKCYAMYSPRQRERIMNMIQIRAAVKLGGVSYIIPDRNK